MQHPLAIIGAGPIGLAAAANAAERGMDFVVLEAGPDAGAAIGEWAHVRGEAADGEHRPVHRDRREYRAHPRAVGQAGVDDRRCSVDPPTDRGEDPLDEMLDPLMVEVAGGQQ